MIEVGTREVKTVYWIKVEGGKSTNGPERGSGSSKDSMKLTLNCESIGSKKGLETPVVYAVNHVH